MLNRHTNMMRGCRIRNRGIPAAFMDNTSSFSPILPKVMSEASSTAGISATGINVNPMYQKKRDNTAVDSPLPINSSI